MDAYSEVITDLVFTRTTNWNFENVRLNNTMLNVLFELDGSKPFGAVVRTVKIPEMTARTVVNELHELGLIRLIKARESKEKEKKKVGVYRGVTFDVDESSSARGAAPLHGGAMAS